jgi:hypothetical protein
MTARDFSLQAFPGTGLQLDLKITGSVTRHYHTFDIRYVLHGPLADLLIPAPAEAPTRRHRLWEETCFEFFLALRNAPRYWEFNLSPAGDWNVYRFCDYREGMQEEPTFARLPFALNIQLDALTLNLKCPLDPIVPANQPLEVAVSAVTRHRNGKATCWALTHPGPQPDFHRRDSFIMDLEGMRQP